MSDTKWTAGPWQRSRSKESGGSFIEHIDSECVSHCVAFVHASHGMFEPPIATEEDAANAHLIASAPELYEALVSCQAWITDGGHEDNPDVAYICGQARTALAKARGES